MVMPGYIIMQNILDSLPVGIVVIQPDGRIAAANPALEKVLGIDEEDIMGQPWAKLLIEDSDNTEFADIIVEAVQLGAMGLHRNILFDRPDGKSVHLSVTTSYLKEDEETIGVVLLISDETERYEFLERDNRHLREIWRLQDERVQGLNKLALSVAHQIRNPLMTIGGFGNLLLRDLGGEAHYREKLETIVDEAGKLELVVDAVRDFASLRAARRSRVASCILLSDLETHARKRAESEGRQLEWSTACPQVDFMIDHEMFGMAMTALIDNAFDFTEGPVILLKIMVNPMDQKCTITLRDRGMGIAEEDLPYVFDPFYSTKPDGIGMGLPRARRIIAEHGGTLDLTASGRGAEAIITLTEQSLDHTEGHKLIPPAIVDMREGLKKDRE